MKITALLLVIMAGSSEPKVTAHAYPGTLAECMEFIAGRSYKEHFRVHCISYSENGATLPAHVLRDIWSLKPPGPLRTDDIPSAPRG